MLRFVTKQTGKQTGGAFSPGKIELSGDFGDAAADAVGAFLEGRTLEDVAMALVLLC